MDGLRNRRAAIHRLYENGTDGTVANCYKGFEVKFGGTKQFTNTYGYDSAGRLQTGSDGAGTIGTYAYTTNSASMGATLTRQTGSAGALVATNTWFQFHDRLDVVANTLAGSSTSAYDYAVNTLGQRTSVAASGSAFSGITGACWSSWGYNDHGEVTGATHSSDSTRNRTFIYDSIGNRKNSRNGSSTAVGYLVTDLVTPSLPSTNKYTKYFSDTDNDGDQDPGETTTLGTPVHDDDGNMTDDGGSGTNGRTFVWDAENRLIQVKDKSTTPKLLATYTYDYRGRRVKKVTTSDAVQGPTQIAYLYDGWNVIAEYDLTAGNPSASPTKRHDWGLDLSGSLQGAGGVGGLIRTKIGSTSYFPTYDGNGNICELVNASNGTFAARYHYDPFGNTVYESGSAAIGNLYRFSSKPVDRESGFYYYGYRYYDAVRGRWLSKDPIGESGGINLYHTLDNSPLNSVDRLGLIELPTGTEEWTHDHLAYGEKRSVQGYTHFALEVKNNCELHVTIKLKFKKSLGAGKDGIPDFDVKDAVDQIGKGVEGAWSRRFVLKCKKCKCPDGLTIVVNLVNDPSGKEVSVGKPPQGRTPNQLEFPYDPTNPTATQQAASHEAGHWLGNHDEYGTVSNVNSGGRPYGQYGNQFHNSSHTFSQGPGTGEINHVNTGDPTGAMSDPNRLPVARNYWLIKKRAESVLGECTLEVIEGMAPSGWFDPNTRGK